jgi:hypothetical protein
VSLDVTLYSNKCESCGRSEAVFSANITHNLGAMAKAAGVYEACWRPDEHGYLKASHILPVLERGLVALESEPRRFKQYDAPNGWGTYEQFVQWLRRYAEACKANPAASVEADV